MATVTEPRVCIIGAGGLSSNRIYPNIAPAGAKLAGVCDLDSAKSETKAHLYGATPYTDWEKMLDSESPDGVIVCVGPEAHAELAPAILRKGFPVYTEKPPSVTAAQALEVARAAKETGLLCMTAFKKRYTHAANRAKEWLAHYPVEDRYSLSIDYCSAQYPNDTPRGDYLLDFALHCIDLTCYLFGAPKQVFAFSKGLDAFAVSVRFEGGAVGTLNLNDGRSFSIPTEEIELTVRGGNFMTIHNSAVWRITEDNKTIEWREPPTFVSGGDSGRDTGHLAELEDFVGALKENRTTRSNIAEGYRTMVFYEGIRKSAKTGQVIELEYEGI